MAQAEAARDALLRLFRTSSKAGEGQRGGAHYEQKQERGGIKWEGGGAESSG